MPAVVQWGRSVQVSPQLGPCACPDSGTRPIRLVDLRLLTEREEIPQVVGQRQVRIAPVGGLDPAHTSGNQQVAGFVPTGGSRGLSRMGPITSHGSDRDRLRNSEQN